VVQSWQASSEMDSLCQGGAQQSEECQSQAHGRGPTPLRWCVAELALQVLVVVAVRQVTPCLQEAVVPFALLAILGAVLCALGNRLGRLVGPLTNWDKLLWCLLADVVGARLVRGPLPLELLGIIRVRVLLPPVAASRSACRSGCRCTCRC